MCDHTHYILIAGFDRQATWEPVENCVGCDQMIAKFEAALFKQDRSPRDQVVVATADNDWTRGRF